MTIQVSVIHNDHTAGTHDGASRAQGLVVDDRIEQGGRDTATGGSAHLDCLELAVILDAAGDVEDDISQRHAHGDLYQAAAANLASQRKDLGALGVFCSHGREFLAAVVR